MTLILIYAPLAFVLGMEFGLWLAAVKAPECTCNDPECGGGCIDWEDAS